MTDKTGAASANAKAENSKKLYTKPTLAVLGSVKQLTQTGSSTKADAQSKMQ